jgi:uncharacterized LabA/DUF88 family protein/predicted  nucleic acid-binding Zn-ribbon protein
MTREVRQVFDRLGADGLGRVLLDVLDHPRLVRLANSCGLEYPGMRTRSQKRERLVADLVQKGFDDEATMLAISRTLRKETAEAARRWGQLTTEQKTGRIGDERFLLRKGNLGLHLYFLAAADGDGSEGGLESLLARKHLIRIAADDQDAKTVAEPSREQLRLEKQLAEVTRKNQHLEAQLAKAREAERSFKRDLIERKGELAEARMLAERLRREVAEASEQARRAAVDTPPVPTMHEALDRLDKAARKLAGEQKRLAHRLDKLDDPESQKPKDRPEQPVKIDPTALEPLVTMLETLRRELAALKRERKADAQQLAGLVETVRGQVQEAVTPVRARRSRSKGEPERVGVFIDVQNMYYGARQLKGKLDFDALQQAAVGDRRLIQAVAYVVESKEIDQSGFIKLLEQRAIEVRRKTLQVRADGSMKGDWDMELAFDILDAAPNLDVVVLVSGDGDFTSLVKRVKAMGPRVEVIGFPRTTAKSLVGAADAFQPLDRRFMIYSRRGRGPEPADEPHRATAEG